MEFKLTSQYKPAGDQPKAIKQLIEGIYRGDPAQILLGVTGSGKTFTVANVINTVNKPTLVLTHNKTLAAQLYGEFKQFFPENCVEYYISYYDYYQPEAYIPSSDLYIEKDLSINKEIERLRLKATSSLLSGRRDVIVVASVSCIYGIGNPEEFARSIIRLKKGDKLNRNAFLLALVEILFSRTEKEFVQGTFRVRGDTVYVFPAFTDFAYRLNFWGDELENIFKIDPISGQKISEEKNIAIFPANLFVTPKDVLEMALNEIKNELELQVDYFYKLGRENEAKRLYEKTSLDIEMLKELGYCSGVENYSRFFDRRKPGSRPFCLLDYFPDDFLLVIDESHATIPQVRGMYHGDRTRKQSLVEYGFRLPSAMDNRPLNFEEFEAIVPQIIFLSATPGKYDLEKSEGIIVEQIVRPTGLLEPKVDVRPSTRQIDDLLTEIHHRIGKNERILITTLTKRMAEELSKYLDKIKIKCRYIHSEIKAIERVEILRGLRLGEFDVLVGVNLLREGLDLPEVSLVAIFDADKEGFLRNETSLIQTAGRAARNINSTVIFYADKITGSMQKAIDEINRRRFIQQNYNIENNITPLSIIKSKESILEQTSIADSKVKPVVYVEPEDITIAADPVVQYLNKMQLNKLAEETFKRMENAAKKQEFLEAARLRDEWYKLKELINNVSGDSSKN